MSAGVSPELRHQAIQEELASKRIISARLSELQYKDRYRLHRGPEQATIDVYYDASQRITGVEPAEAGGSARLVLDAIGCVESLPASFLRPRFRNRVASPRVLTEMFSRALDEIGFDAVGLRLSQFQLMYDLVDRGDPTGRTFQVSVHYDKRGRVTYVSGATGQDIPEHVLEVFRSPGTYGPPLKG